MSKIRTKQPARELAEALSGAGTEEKLEVAEPAKASTPKPIPDSIRIGRKDVDRPFMDTTWLFAPTRMKHPERGNISAAKIDFGQVGNEEIDGILTRHQEILTDAGRKRGSKVQVAAYMPLDLPPWAQAKFISNLEAKFKKKYPHVEVLPRYVDPREIEKAAAKKPKRWESELEALDALPEIPLGELGPTEAIAFGDKEVEAEVKSFVEKARAAGIWIGKPRVNWWAGVAVGGIKALATLFMWGRWGDWRPARLALETLDPAFEAIYAPNQKEISAWLRRHRLMLVDRLGPAGVKLNDAYTSELAQVIKSWVYNVAIFSAGRPALERLANWNMDPTHVSAPWSPEFLAEVAGAGLLILACYTLGEKGYERLREMGLITAPAQRYGLWAASGFSLATLLLYTSGNKELKKYILLTLPPELLSYLAVFAISFMASTRNNRFVAVEPNLAMGSPRYRHHLVEYLDELEYLHAPFDGTALSDTELAKAFEGLEALNAKPATMLQRWGARIAAWFSKKDAGAAHEGTAELTAPAETAELPAT